MGFQDREDFEGTSYIEQSQEIKKLIIMAFEGAETEYKYFSHIENNFELKNSVEMALIERDEENKNSSSPTKVVQTLTNIIDNDEKLKEIKSSYKGFDNSYDIFWIIVDREKQESKKVNLLRALEICKANNINISLSNPTFELWLILHFDISEYESKDLYDNRKDSQRAKRYLEKELTRQIGSYNKSIPDTSFITLENIQRALVQEKKFKNNLEQIIDNLGSNVGDLIREILEFKIIN